MVVKLTQEQANYLKTFGEKKEKAVYYISRWGLDYSLYDGNDRKYEYEDIKPFTLYEKMKIIEAVINGYEVAVPKFKFYNFSDSSGYKSLYYQGDLKELTANSSFAKEVKKDSEEYLALIKLGFCREEV